MDRAEKEAAVALPVILGVGALVAWAASQGGVQWSGLPVFALCAAAAFGINWIAFVPSYLKRTERFFDLLGSATYMSVVLVALLLGGGGPRSVLLAVLIFVWAGRLGSFLFARVHKAGEDRRFRAIKQSFVRFLMAWTLQGLWVLLTAACALAAMTAAAGGSLDAFALAGGLIWLLGFSVEVAADRQKSAFKADPSNEGQFIRGGLWAWSRHPNYFGEIVLWTGIAIIAFPALSGWQLTTLISPLFVYVLLTRISGIPMLESRADRKWRSDTEYEAYKSSTPALWPRPPRSAAG